MTDGDTVTGVTTSDAWATLSEINHWIRFADTKGSVLLAVGGVVGGILLSRPPTELGQVSTVDGAMWTVAMVAVALGCLLSLRALLPRLRTRGQAMSLLYFDHIARDFAGKRDEYLAAFTLTMADVDAVHREVASQIWVNSDVARRKFRDVALATWLIAIGLVSCGVFVYLERL